MIKQIVFILVLLAVPAPAQEDLAQGRAVRFANPPAYALTAAGGTDSTDLTDGKLSSRSDDKLWFDNGAVGYSYQQLAQLAVDLGAVKAIDEVAVRVQGGSPQTGVTVPVWLDVLVSEDGGTWRRVAGYSVFQAGDFERAGIPGDEGKAWVHRLRFKDLHTRGRHVGLSFYGAALSVMDEMWVIGGPDVRQRAHPHSGAGFPMAIDGVLPYFHKPTVRFTTNIATPTPIGVIGAPDALGREVRVQLELPQGLKLVGGAIGGVKAEEMAAQTVSAHGGPKTRYAFRTTPSESSSLWGRIYLGGQWRPGRQGALRYRVNDGDWFTQPIEAITVRPVTAPKRLCVGLSWWPINATQAWPGAIKAFRTLGLNTVPMFAHWTAADDPEPWQMLDQFRAGGFWVMNTDSPLHRMQSRHRKDTEIYCRFEDGTHGSKLCPSYRGKHFVAEVERLAAQAQQCKARFHNWDIEIWGWRGPLDSRKCTRCQADKEAAGIEDWAHWQAAKGVEMFTAMAAAVTKALHSEGVTEIDLGMYDLRPGPPYQGTWNFASFYPGHVTNSQVSTYTPYYPYHLELIAGEVRADRARLPKTDQMPWLTPGNAGAFPGRMFKYALLEVFANGSRGVNFWSMRVWDSETLAAYADAIRIVRQVEDVIVDGDLLHGAEASDGVRVSGMQRGGEMFVLVSDYDDDASDPVHVALAVTRPSHAIDLESGRRVAELTPENNTIAVNFAHELARAYHVVSH